MKGLIKSVLDVSISHYQRLGVAPGVDPEALRQAFRRKSKALHPDTTALPEAQASMAFQQLKESYALLADPGRRDAYDAMLRANCEASDHQAGNV
jgi:DnaJ-class molecular chaperone